IGSVTYAKALAQSSNVCAIKTGLRVGKENFYSALQRLGFGQRSGIELPAETGGIVRNPAKWNGDSLASMSIGYEIGVSALQMVTAFATIANDGVRIQPHIIKEIRQSDEIIDRGAEPAKTQAFSAETARDLRKMLREVVLTGTARRAQLDGYTSAGKTGTAWKFDEETKKISSSKYISSFIGFVPAENPVVTIGVVMDEPKVGGRDGGQVAAPVFHDIAEQILPELGVARQGGTNQQLTASNEVVPEAAPMEPGTADMPAAEPDERHAAKAASQPAAASKKAHAAAKPSLPARPPADDKARSASRPKAVEPSKLKAPIKNKSST
ncbi:MAG: penicillin-binding transpeptidase domain-containing protein, partial [Pyrinomonadaceae bacterium]